MKRLDDKIYEIETYEEINTLIDIVDIRYNSIIYLGTMHDSIAGKNMKKYIFAIVALKDLNESKTIKDLITKHTNNVNELIKDAITITATKK